MANFRYFADTQDGPVELTSVWHDGAASTAARHFTGITPDHKRLSATRKVEMKPNPSNHQCGPRCMNATRFLCECSCRGANHGRAAFMCEGTK